MVCFVIVFVAIAKGPASSRTIVVAVASYVILAVLGDMHGYPSKLRGGIRSVILLGIYASYMYCPRVLRFR